MNDGQTSNQSVSGHGERQDEAASRKTDKAPVKLSAVLNEIEQAEDKLFDGGILAFKEWSVMASLKEPRPLQASSIALYEIVWRAWLRFLKDQQQKGYREALTKDVLAFLDQICAASLQNSSGAKQEQSGESSYRPPRNTNPSEVSRKRYARVLSDVYRHARLFDLVPEDVQPVQPHTKGIPEHEDAETFLMQREFRRAMIKAIPVEGSHNELRDAAIVALMLLQGLTSGEVSSLSGVSLNLPGLTGLPEMQQSKEWQTAPKPISVKVSGARSAQDRTLELDDLTASALQRWIAVRGLWLGERKSNKLFIGKRGVMPMTGRALFEVAKNFVLEVMEKEKVTATMFHVGPMALRNSCLVSWLDGGMEPDEVRARAGLLGIRSIGRVVKRASTAAQQRFEAYQQERQSSKSEEPEEQEEMADNCG